MKAFSTLLLLSIVLGASCISLRKAHSQQITTVKYPAGFRKLSPANTAIDISVGADGTMYMIDTIFETTGYGGNHIRKWNDAKQDWDASIGTAMRVAVNPQGLPWITNDAEEIWALTPGGFLRVGFASTDIGASPNGYMTVVGSSAEHIVWRNTAGPVNVWVALEGQTAGSVAGDPQGNPWITGYTDNVVYRWNGSKWVAVPGVKATDIGIGADGTVWVVSDRAAASGGNQVAIFNPATGRWIYAPQVGATRVSVYPNGDLVAVDNQGGVFRLTKPIIG